VKTKAPRGDWRGVLQTQFRSVPETYQSTAPVSSVYS
jgi:hypothetical protein